MPARTFVLLSLVIVSLAIFVRIYFVAVAQIESPIRGDITEYVAYADNLLEHGTFSRDRSGSAPAPDAFRSPGYPMFLALAKLAGRDGWYAWALGLQIAIAGASVALTLLLARRLMSDRWALACATLAALWPHHIVATATLLSEVVFGATLLAAMLAAGRTARLPQGRPVLAGFACGAAALVNPVAVLLPALLCALRLRRGQRRAALALLLSGLLLPAAWSLRNALVVPASDEPGRLAMNFVQGSWPQYHRAHNTRTRSPVSQDIIDAINAETAVLHASPRAGLAAMAERMALDPGYYLAWYVWQKPYLLWAWDIRIGIGDVYYHRIEHSPLETHPVLAPLKSLLRALNPVLFALMLGFVTGIAWVRVRRAPDARVENGVDLAAFLLYVTAVHWLLQAEPRYAIAYRPFELIGATAFLSAVARRMHHRTTGAQQETDAGSSQPK